MVTRWTRSSNPPQLAPGVCSRARIATHHSKRRHFHARHTATTIIHCILGRSKKIVCTGQRMVSVLVTNLSRMPNTAAPKKVAPATDWRIAFQSPFAKLPHATAPSTVRLPQPPLSVHQNAPPANRNSNGRGHVTTTFRHEAWSVLATVRKFLSGAGLFFLKVSFRYAKPKSGLYRPYVLPWRHILFGRFFFIWWLIL